MKLRVHHPFQLYKCKTRNVKRHNKKVRRLCLGSCKTMFEETSAGCFFEDGAYDRGPTLLQRTCQFIATAKRCYALRSNTWIWSPMLERMRTSSLGHAQIPEPRRLLLPIQVPACSLRHHSSSRTGADFVRPHLAESRQIRGCARHSRK